MYAVVEIAGLQFEVQPKDIVTVPLLKGEPGDTVSFSNILLFNDNSDVKVGQPYLNGSVEAKILAHGKGQKLIVFKKKRRKGYRKLNGHRQKFTKIEINNINID